MGKSESVSHSAGLVAHPSPWSMEFFKQEYWSGLPFSSAGDLLNSGIEPRSLALPAVSLLSEPPRRVDGRLMNSSHGATSN